MSNKITGIAMSALFGVAVAAFSTSGASAATSVPYQKYISRSPTCTDDVCIINFPVVPAGKRLEISNSSCYIRHAPNGPGFGSLIYAAQLIVRTAGGGVVTAVTLNPVRVSNSIGSPNNWASNDEVFIFAAATQHVQAYVEKRGGTYQQVACSISGHLVTP